jgi:hypothetical protein
MRTCQFAAAAAAAVAVAVAVSGCHSAPTKPSPPPAAQCTFQVGAANSSVGFEGGRITITVTTAATCAWSARSDATWVAFESGATGTGPGTVVAVAAANAGADTREAVVTIADQSVRVTQQGRAPCTIAAKADRVAFDAGGGTGSVTVTTAAHCAWTVTASDPWVALGPASGSGNGVAPFTVAPWTGSTERTATIRVAEQTIELRQSRDQRTCAYSVSPVDAVLHWHGTGGEIQVHTDADCVWTVASAAAWLTFNGPSSRSGHGVLQFVTPTFTDDATRRAALELRWAAPSSGQNVWVSQEGCRYGAYPATMSFDAAGGRGMFTVVTQPVSSGCALGCPWTATPAVSWIQIASGSPGAGDDAFFVNIPANPGAARSGTISVAGQIVRVVQGGS